MALTKKKKIIIGSVIAAVVVVGVVLGLVLGLTLGGDDSDGGSSTTASPVSTSGTGTGTATVPSGSTTSGTSGTGTVPPDPVVGGKWAWATTTLDGPGDWNDRFCGSDLADATKSGPDVVHTGVSIPWAFVCSKFGSKGNLMNHMCPLCPKDNNDPSCMVNNAYMAKTWAKNKAGVVNTYESLMAEEDGLYENGYCFELQPLKFKQEEFIATDFEPQGLYKGGSKSLQGDDVLPSGWDPKETVIAKIAVGCGGNCTPHGEAGGKPDSCPAPVDTDSDGASKDCTNYCVAALGVDPCNVTDSTPSAGDTCNFLKYGNGIKWDWTQISEDSLYSASSCMLPFSTETGKFQEVGGVDFRNWCSGAHMHFDTTNTSKLNQPSGGLTNIMVRWRPVKCPPPS